MLPLIDICNEPQHQLFIQMLMWQDVISAQNHMEKQNYVRADCILLYCCPYGASSPWRHEKKDYSALPGRHLKLHF